VLLVYVISCSFTAPPPAPVITNQVAAISSITITWSQNSVELVDSYTISYSYDFNACPGEYGGIGKVSDIDGKSNSYVLTNLRPYAEYNITITAENFNGSSSSNSVKIATKETSNCGKLRRVLLYCF